METYRNTYEALGDEIVQHVGIGKYVKRSRILKGMLFMEVKNGAIPP
jgi:hypothetical protein